MKKLAAVCATVVLATTLGLAQGTASQTASDDNRASAPATTRNDDPNRRGTDFGWIGLLGLLGLAGLRRRTNTAADDRERERTANLRRVA
jgi:MYXO-CTERM domain-containing protein